MSGVTNNPLRKYFREPGLSIRLPSGGYFYPKGMVEFGMTGEIEVYPMTAYDELLLKNPDGLLSGDAVIKIIHSCVPGVRDARHLCMADVDAILLAIRAATSGDEMSVDAACPACQHANTFGLSIRYLIETATEHDREYPVDLSDTICVLMRPHSYETSTKASLATFQQVKVIQTLRDRDLSEAEKTAVFDQAFTSLCLSNLTVMAEAVQAVIVPEGMVEDRDHILEFVRNIDARKAELLQKKLEEINAIGVPKNQPAVCQKCEHRWEARLSYDPSHFFG